MESKRLVEFVMMARQGDEGAIATPPAITAPVESVDESSQETTTEEAETTPLEEEQTLDLDVILTSEQLTILLPLEKALLDYDISAAIPVLASVAFREIYSDLPNDFTNVYKRDEHGEWGLIYFSGHADSGEFTENCQLYLVTDWNEGNLYLAEAQIWGGNLNYGILSTYDIENRTVGGAYDFSIARIIDGNVVMVPFEIIDGVLHINTFEPEE